jgi:hypothetical protein
MVWKPSEKGLSWRGEEKGFHRRAKTVYLVSVLLFCIVALVVDSIYVKICSDGFLYSCLEPAVINALSDLVLLISSSNRRGTWKDNAMVEAGRISLLIAIRARTNMV